MKDKLKRILSTHIDVDTLIVNNKEYYWIKQNIDWESINGDIFSEAKNYGQQFVEFAPAIVLKKKQI